MLVGLQEPFVPSVRSCGPSKSGCRSVQFLLYSKVLFCTCLPEPRGSEHTGDCNPCDVQDISAKLGIKELRPQLLLRTVTVKADTMIHEPIRHNSHSLDRSVFHKPP